jgi:membrane protease YdiL (CAAX protease family)
MLYAQSHFGLWWRLWILCQSFRAAECSFSPVRVVTAITARRYGTSLPGLLRRTSDDTLRTYTFVPTVDQGMDNIDDGAGTSSILRVSSTSESTRAKRRAPLQWQQLWLFARRRVGWTFGQRKQRWQLAKLQGQQFRQSLIDVGHGACHVFTNLDCIFLYLAIPVGLSTLLLELISKSALLYQAYWCTMSCLSYVSKTYSIVSINCLNTYFTWIWLQTMIPFTVLMLVVVTMVCNLLGNLAVHLPPATATLLYCSMAAGQMVQQQQQIPSLIDRCIWAPFMEEILFRYFPSVALARRFKKRTRNNKTMYSGQQQQQQDVFTKRFDAICSLLFGAAHISNHVALGAKLADITFLHMWRATVQSVAAFVFASRVLLPLYRRRGLAAATGAHMAWNSSLSVMGPKRVLGLAALVLANRLFQSRSNTLQYWQSGRTFVEEKCRNLVQKKEV